MLHIVTANVNGVRAAARRGGLEWLARSGADVLALQEVRAGDAELAKVLAEAGLGDLHVAHTEGNARGRAGVAVLSRLPVAAVRVGLGEEFADAGRWIEADVVTQGGPVTVVSVYAPTGEAGTPRQEEKERFLAAMGARMGELAPPGDTAALAVVCGDVNVAHREADLRNWRGNLAKAGFLPQERAHLDGWLAAGWVDVQRRLAGDVEGPYSWWSWRGSAFDRDVGWRIDYHLASPALAARAVTAATGRAETYAQRWSDHAAVTVRYDLGGGMATGD